jgi:D-sedoheptulose 7-phosphate isomerase
MNFSRQHMLEVAKIAELIDISKIEEMIDVLVQVKKSGGRLFILGVGGSAGNASHAVNDFRKLVGIEAYAPTDNVSEVTARTNDEGFDTIFTAFLSVSRLSTNDCLLILSVGGGDVERAISKNICSAIDFSKSQNARVIGIVGREGGYTHEHADVCLVIPSVNPIAITPHSEAFQSVVWHLMVSHPKLKTNLTKW